MFDDSGASKAVAKCRSFPAAEWIQTSLMTPAESDVGAYMKSLHGVLLGFIASLLPWNTSDPCMKVICFWVTLHDFARELELFRGLQAAQPTT